MAWRRGNHGMQWWQAKYKVLGRGRQAQSCPVQVRACNLGWVGEGKGKACHKGQVVQVRQAGRTTVYNKNPAKSGREKAMSRQRRCVGKLWGPGTKGRARYKA